jgi:acyl-homoserine-lactone acylase
MPSSTRTAAYNAMPWVNTMATSADGRAVYLDNSSVGNLSSRDAQERLARVLAQDRLAAGLYQQRGLVLLDGSDPENEWLDDPATPLRAPYPSTSAPLSSATTTSSTPMTATG